MLKLNKLMLLAFAALLVLVSCEKEAGVIDTNSSQPAASDKGAQIQATVSIDKTQESSMIQYINRIRANPAAYSSTMGVDLSYIAARPALRVDSILVKVAEKKALDMATRNYVSHTTPEGLGINIMIYNAGYKIPTSWISPQSNNYFESIAANFNSMTSATGNDIVKQFIVDKNVPSLGHRNHLLGVGSWNASLYDIGVGFARIPWYIGGKVYVSVVIAKHNW